MGLVASISVQQGCEAKAERLEAAGVLLARRVLIHMSVHFGHLQLLMIMKQGLACSRPSLLFQVRL